MLRRLPLALLALLPQCSFDHAESGDLCIYTARSSEQVYSEIPAFVDAHPGIRLRCPDIRADSGRRGNLLCERASGVWASGDACAEDSRWELYRESTGALTDTIADQRAHDRLSADVLWGVAVTHVQHLYQLDGTIFRRYEPRDTFRVAAHLENEGATPGSFWSWFLDPTYTSTAEDHPRWVGVDAFAVVLCINTAKLAELPPLPEGPRADDPLDPATLDDLTWEDLLDPRLTGRIAAPQADQSGTGFAQLVGELHPEYRPCSAANMSGCEYDWDYLDRLDPQIALYTKSGDLPCQLAAHKGGDIVIGITHDGAAFLKPTYVERDDASKYDAPKHMRRVFPTRDGVVDTGFDVAVSALVDHPEIRPAAHTFLDWSSSREAMALYAASTPLTAYNPHDEPIPEELEQVRTFELHLDTAAEKMPALKSSWSEKFCPEKPATADVASDLQIQLDALKRDDPGLDKLDTEHRCAAYLAAK